MCQQSNKKRVPAKNISVIPNGIYPGELSIKTNRRDLENILGFSLNGKIVIVTTGRLVKRKGVYWFSKNVIPRLGNNLIYLVVGDGKDRPKIEELIKSKNLEKKIILLGKISSYKLKVIYNNADVFVMPNIRVKGDIEGFGVVALEAASVGLKVIASDVDGIADAINHKKNGYLVRPEVNKWVETIKAITADKYLTKQKIREWTIKNYSWQVISRNYIDSIKHA
jgi:phosphatidyl-myo-inositol dimannoside synthase